MAQTLTTLLYDVRQASCPEDVFGPLTPPDLVGLKRRYRELAAVAHPDHNAQQVAAATEAFQRLQRWFAEASAKVAQGTYGASPQLILNTRRTQYVSYTPPLRGDLADLYAAEASGNPVLVKVARSARNNDLLQTEADSLGQLARALDGAKLRAHFPTLIEHFFLDDSTGVRRHGNVLRSEPGTATLAAVLAAHPAGLDLRDAAWMFNRMLAALGATHDCGLVHGAVVPGHVLIRPDDHNGILIDWCYSVPIGTPIKAISQLDLAAYPPEVRAKQPAMPATDVYMAAHLLLRLLGGGSAAQELPEHVPKPVRALLRPCLLSAPQRRTSDAWQLFDDFREILATLYGSPVFRPFRMPAPCVGQN